MEVKRAHWVKRDLFCNGPFLMDFFEDVLEEMDEGEDVLGSYGESCLC